MALLAAAVILLSSGVDETAQLAAEVGVDPVLLQGAANATGTTPRAYLTHEGLLSPPVAQAAPRLIWDVLAACESGGDWSAVSYGGTYRGGLQQDMTFWRQYGGLAYAARPELASREQQIIVAQRGQAVQGWGAWPVCRRRLGI